eukprot:2438728-Rhodomonas_salina.1
MAKSGSVPHALSRGMFILFLLAADSIGIDDLHLIRESWSACTCGALEIVSLGSNHSGLVVAQQRDVSREEAVFAQYGVVSPFAFVFDNPDSGIRQRAWCAMPSPDIAVAGKQD